MSTYTDDIAFLYQAIMKTNFMRSATPSFGKKPTLKAVEKLVAAADPKLPFPFRSGYVTPLLSRLDGLFAREDLANAEISLILETIAGAVYQHGGKSQLPALRRFLAVISDLYRSFLDTTKREHLNVPLTEVLPPLAVFQSSPEKGPFTIPIDQIDQLIGASVGVVSLPATFVEHPFLFGSLAHETGGHDVLHADIKLLPQLRAEVHTLFHGPAEDQVALLWDYWMDEAASDVYGVLNMGPAFGANLAVLLAVFVAQGAPKSVPKPKIPTLRVQSGTLEDGSLDPHPTDILRLALIQGAISSLTALRKPVRDRYIAEIDELAALCAPNASTIDLTGFARISTGRAIDFDTSFPITDMRQAAFRLGVHIATVSLDALGGHSVQAIETWNDADESSANTIATRLRAGQSVVNGGDDAQILAGFTLAILDQPHNYSSFSKLATEALDDSFRRDPYWGKPTLDNFVVHSTKPLPPPNSPIDPYAARIIDYNPLDEDPTGLAGIIPGIVTLHTIDPIPWPAGKKPAAVPMANKPSPSDPLPAADIVFITWTAAEANAMALTLTPGYIAMPPSSHVGDNVWYPYAHKFASYKPKLRPGGSPALQAGNLGKYFFSKIGNERILCFKSSLHLARDTAALPVKDLFKQIALETGAKLIITTGTAGAIGPRLILGDAVIATQARFDCMRMFKNESFNGQTYTSTYQLNLGTRLATAHQSLIPANVSHLPSLPRSPRIYTGDTVLGEPNVIVTTDIFAYDDSTNHFQLQGKGSMVEMDDAVLGLACAELGNAAPDWLAIRNASDPQVGPSLTKADAAKIYEDYGYWTSLTSVIACWAVVA